MKKLLIPMVLVAAMLGQAPVAKLPKHSAAAKPSIDTVIELVQGGMSESFIIKTLQSQGKAYSLSPEDMVKLQKAGVTEPIIVVMVDPKASVVLPTPSTTAAPPVPAAATPPEVTADKGPSPASADPAPVTAPANAGAVTPPPPDLDRSLIPVRKHRVAVDAFGYGAVRDWVQYWFGNDANIGEGIRAMLTSQLQESKDMTLLERGRIDLVLDEQNHGNTDRWKQKTKARVGRILGADCILIGDITIFGRDDKIDTKGGGVLGAIASKNRILAGLAGAKLLSKDDKAVVGISFRIVDAETAEQIWAGDAKGESSRKSKDYSALLGGLGSRAGALAGFANNMNSTNFEKTIIGEATANAVKDIAKQLGEKIAQIPLKPRDIEGRVASVTANGVYLALGGNDGVLPGDRFEILEIKNDVIDQQTREVIDVEAVKVGELVINEVHDHASIGNYGGQPLLLAQVTGKGYQARLMSK